jgi:hypothetical protein
MTRQGCNPNLISNPPLAPNSPSSGQKRIGQPQSAARLVRMYIERQPDSFLLAVRSPSDKISYRFRL